LSAETRAKIAAAHKGLIPNAETRAKLSAASKGRRMVPRGQFDQFEAFLDQHPAERQAIPAIDLGQPGKPAFARGKPKRPLTRAEREVLGALLQKFPRSLTSGEIASESKRGGWRTVLRRLREDPDWEAAIKFPGTSYQGYRIASTSECHMCQD
jgi:hypothetical protein